MSRVFLTRPSLTKAQYPATKVEICFIFIWINEQTPDICSRPPATALSSLIEESSSKPFRRNPTLCASASRLPTSCRSHLIVLSCQRYHGPEGHHGPGTRSHLSITVPSLH